MQVFFFFNKKLGKKTKTFGCDQNVVCKWVGKLVDGVAEVKRMVFVFRMIGRKTNEYRI